MSKTIAELYDEVIASEELQQECLAAAQESEDAVAAFVAAHDCEATIEEIVSFLKAKFEEDGELSMDELDLAAGGHAVRGKDDVGPMGRGRRDWECRLNCLGV